MTISIIHPSRNRPEMALDTASKWLNSLSGKYKVEYILSIDADEPQKDKYQAILSSLYLDTKSSEKAIKLVTKANKSAIEAINNAAIKSENDLIIVVSDDFDCFQDWDSWLVEKLQGQEDFLVKTSDGIQEWLITLPIMDRKYYQRFGYVYYPEYLHMFCDTEMTEVGHILGRVIDLRDSEKVFVHKHHTAGFMIKDALAEKNDATWNQGEELFNLRKNTNFNINV